MLPRRYYYSDEGLQRLKKFLAILLEAGLTLRLDKCNFMATEIKYLGHVINEGTITPGTDKVEAIRRYPSPTSVTEVRRFLGLVGFFRKLVPDFSTIAKPLTSLLRKTEGTIINWEKSQEQAFEKLIEALCNKPLLALYD